MISSLFGRTLVFGDLQAKLYEALFLPGETLLESGLDKVPLDYCFVGLAAISLEDMIFNNRTLFANIIITNYYILFDFQSIIFYLNF